MRSVRSDRTDLALLAAAQRLTLEQRLEAFVVHCRLMMDLYAEGKRIRETPVERPRQ